MTTRCAVRQSLCRAILIMSLYLFGSAPSSAEIVQWTTSTYSTLASSYSNGQKLASGQTVDGLVYRGFRYGRTLAESYVYPDSAFLTNARDATATRIFTADGTDFAVTTVKLRGLSVGVAIEASGWRDGVLITSKSFTVEAGLSATVSLGFARIDEIRFSGLVSLVAIDDLTFGPPAPSSDLI